MENSEFKSILQNIEERLIGTHFQTTYSQYNPESLGNFYIDISNGKYFYRLIKDRSQYFLEGKSVDCGDWKNISQFIENNFKGSTLAVDMKLHKIGQSDFTIETILKLLYKLLLISKID